MGGYRRNRRLSRIVPTMETSIINPIGKYTVTFPRRNVRSPGSRSNPIRLRSRNRPPITSSATAAPTSNFPMPSSPTLLILQPDRQRTGPFPKLRPAPMKGQYRDWLFVHDLCYIARY